MALEENWHDDDSFWLAVEPFMFNKERWEGTAGEVDLLLKLVPLLPEAVICDVGCGPGRFSLELARHGFQVIGIDRTEPYLHSGRNRAKADGLYVEFVLADMRSFVWPNAVDCAISMYTTFGFFEYAADNQLVLENINRSLKDGGVLVMEMMGKEILARIFLPRGWDQAGGKYLLQERKVSKDWSWIENRWILIDGRNRLDYIVSHWVYAATELKKMLLDTGFDRVQFFGNLKGEPYDQNAERLVAVAYK